MCHMSTADRGATCPLAAHEAPVLPVPADTRPGLHQSTLGMPALQMSRPARQMMANTQQARRHGNVFVHLAPSASQPSSACSSAQPKAHAASAHTRQGRARAQVCPRPAAYQTLRAMMPPNVGCLQPFGPPVCEHIQHSRTGASRHVNRTHPSPALSGHQHTHAHKPTCTSLYTLASSNESHKPALARSTACRAASPRRPAQVQQPGRHKRADSGSRSVVCDKHKETDGG